MTDRLKQAADRIASADALIARVRAELAPMKSISFDGESMRQILAGRKGQTRRPVKWKPLDDGLSLNTIAHFDQRPEHGWAGYSSGLRRCTEWLRCPYEPGLRWVKEPLVEVEVRPSADRLWEMMRDVDARLVSYAADMDPVLRDDQIVVWPWKPSHLPAMYCPRWASRLTIEILSVRVERLQDISEADAIAEGCWASEIIGVSIDGGPPMACARNHTSARDVYARRWDAINGKKPGARWADNPWVWVVSFRVVPPEERR